MKSSTINLTAGAIETAGHGVTFGEKAVEDYRTPRRWREFRWRMNNAKRHGVRQSSGAFGSRRSNVFCKGVKKQMKEFLEGC
ncbi:MAG: hypothetical protein ACR2H1_08380 [Limisphaerales bacterium]